MPLFPTQHGCVVFDTSNQDSQINQNAKIGVEFFDLMLVGLVEELKNNNIYLIEKVSQNRVASNAR